jgi:hypothetical protein
MNVGRTALAQYGVSTLIIVPTVLILGAGASAPYGFPCGQELKDRLVRALGPIINQAHLDLRTAGCSGTDIHAFREALLFSGQESVDAFLEHRPEFLNVGKAAIAQALIPCENLEALFRTPDWYGYLYQRLKANLRNLSDFATNKLAVVTYNYDRSFEQYMFTALKNSFGAPDDEVVAALSGIPVIHLHGQLGFLPWQQGPSRKYDESCGAEDIKLGVWGIKIIHESLDAEYEQMYERVRDAKRVIFLGFGYHEMNMLRLNPERTMADPKVFGTCYGIKPLELSHVHSRFGRKRINLAQADIDSLRFLREIVDL